jgi:hypothetical protein
MKGREREERGRGRLLLCETTASDSQPTSGLLVELRLQ